MKLSSKILEAKRKKLYLTKAEFASWLGFRTTSKNRTRALVSQYFQLCHAVDGDERYSVGPKTLRRVINRLDSK